MSLQSTSLNNCRTIILASSMKMFRNSTTLRSLLRLSEISMMISPREWNFLSHLRLKSPRFSNSLTKPSTGNNNSYQWSHPSSAMTPRSVSLQCGQFLWAWSQTLCCANFTMIMLITSTLPFLTTKLQLKGSSNNFPSLVEITYSWSLTRSSPHFPLK